MVQSILDSDLYKLTMQYAVMETLPNLKVKYKFTDRKGKIYPKGFASELSYEIRKMEELILTDSQEAFMRKLDFFPQPLLFYKPFQCPYMLIFLPVGRFCEYGLR